MDLSGLLLYLGTCWSMTGVSLGATTHSKENVKGTLESNLYMSHNTMAGLLKSRHKRGDCVGSQITVDCDCCHTECSISSLQSALYNYCFGSTVCQLFLSNQNSPSWKTSPSDETFISAWCNLEQNCYDSLFGFSCTCNKGYGVIDCNEIVVTNGTPQEDQFSIVLPATLTPVCLIMAVVVFVSIKLYLRYKNKQGDFAKMQIKCDILIAVDDKDEYKVYTDDLINRSMKNRTRINVKRMSISHLYIDNYSIKCDKVMFILHKEFNSLDSCVGVILSKIHFRKQRRSTALFIHVDDVSNEIALENERITYTDKISNFNIKNKCLYVIRKMKYLDEWLPYVLREVFRIRSKGLWRLNTSSFFMRCASVNADSDTIITLSETLERTLDIIGATKSTSPDSATCIITVARNVSDIDIKEHLYKKKPRYVFLTMYSLNEDSVIGVYNREHIVKGIIDVLVCLKMI